MARICWTLLFVMSAMLGVAMHAHAAPTDEKIHELNTQVLRVNVTLKNGRYGTGSGVVVAKNQVATNCHVVAHAASVNVVSQGAEFVATGVKPDWKHDVCVLEVKGLDVNAVTIGSTKQLTYEQSVFTIGYPGSEKVSTNAFGKVKALYPMDGAVVMRATNAFKVGASGGGAFDDEGALIGLITLKSPGETPYYYYMAAEWVQALLDKPALPITTKSASPFWAQSAQASWPHFMKVVHPYLTHDWKALTKIASDWVKAEPDTNEAWFYLAAAEYAQHDLNHASVHMRQVVASNHEHIAAVFYLGLIAEKNGQHQDALAQVALLDNIDVAAADALSTALSKY